MRRLLILRETSQEIRQNERGYLLFYLGLALALVLYLMLFFALEIKKKKKKKR
jgi:hypothetical protein